MKNLGLKDIKSRIKERYDTLQNTYHVKTIGIFGSYVKGNQNKNSDVDILVDFSEPVGFFEFLDLEDYLHRILSRKVDLVSVGGLKEIIKDDVMKNVKYI